MADHFWLAAALYQLALTQELLGTDAAGWHRFTGGGRVHRSHTGVGAAQRWGTVPHPSTWPYGGDAIPIVDGHGGVLLPRVTPNGEALEQGVLYAYQSSAGANPPYDPTCALFTPAGFAGTDNTAVGNYAAADAWTEFDAALPALVAAQRCNASCWATPACTAWDLIKVTSSSGKSKPTCGLFTATTPVGCRDDPNQFAGAREPLPVPPEPDATTQHWTLPLAWVGKDLRTTVLSPEGPVDGLVQATVVGRNLTLSGIVPTWAVKVQVV